MASLMSGADSRAGILAWLAALVGTVLAVPASAEAGLFASGDSLLRMDLQLLDDAEVIHLPLNQWPLPRAAVRYAIDNAKPHFATNKAVALALSRVRARLESSESAWSTGVSGTVGNPGRLRSFDALGRENAEVAAHAGYAGERFSASLNLAAVASPDDGQELRVDNSHLSMQLGNWILSANTL